MPPTDPTGLSETSRVSMTSGMERAMVRYGAARSCPECKLGLPRYPGRYPSKCPRCGQPMGGQMKENASVPVVCVSRAHRIQKLIESGRKSFAPYLRDESCSRVVSIPYSRLSEVGGPSGFKRFLEGPLAEGRYYRVEGVEDPVLIFEFNDRTDRMTVFASSNPSRYLPFDPRSEFVVEDHDSTFEDGIQEGKLQEGFLQRVAERVIEALRKKLSKLTKLRRHLRTVADIWREAERASGERAPATTELRMAKALPKEMEAAFSGVRERVESVDDADPLDEAMGITTVLGLALGVLGGVPLLLGGLLKAAKFLNKAGVQAAGRVIKPLEHAYHVVHHFEQEVVDILLPDSLSYRLYVAAWKRGLRLTKGLQLQRAARRREERDPLSYDEYVNNREVRMAVEGALYKLLLLYFAFSGLMAILHAPLGALFAAEAAATSVKGVEIGQGLQRAARVVRALEAVDPSNIRMVNIGQHGLTESVDPAALSDVHVFLTEEQAAEAASARDLALVPSRRLVGEEEMWVLVHEGTGYALGRGELGRIDEANALRSASYGPERARQRASSAGRKHDRVAGEFRMGEDKRASIHRPRKPGEGPTQVRGGFRIHVGHNRTRKPRKDVQRNLQGRLNARRGLNKRVQKAKEWHRSREGDQLHRALGRYNRTRSEAEEHDAALRDRIATVRDRIVQQSAGQQRSPVHETIGVMGAPKTTHDATAQITSVAPSQMDDPTIEDTFDSVLRRLIVGQDMDVLQDVEFDEATGGIYLFFDPVLSEDEMQEVLQSVQQAQTTATLIASPDLSLPGESVESDWWVVLIPGKEGLQPDPSIYARDPSRHATKVQTVVMAPENDAAAVAQGVDLSKMIKAAGK